MKRSILFTLLCGSLLAGCTNNSDEIIGKDDQPTKNIKASELFVYSGSQKLNTRAIYDKTEELGYSIPKDGKYDVWFYIRIDNNIPGEDQLNLPSNQYFPQTAAGKTQIDDKNHGMVNANVAWHESTAKKFPKYVYSTDGTAVQSILAQEPTLEDIVAANKSTKYNLNGYIEHKDELHFLWYACKQQSADHIWHVDGILTSKDRTDISQTIYGEQQMENYKEMVNDKGDVNRKGHVEVDVHQQEHKDWNEIKTSIHLRDTVTAEVFIPLNYDEIVKADDFDIRYGRDYDYITELMDTQIEINNIIYQLQVSIKHEQTGIRIIVQPNKEALVAARQEYGDGITFEIHSYVTNTLPNSTIWDKLKQTTVTTTPYTDIMGQITSAFYQDGIKF